MMLDILDIMLSQLVYPEELKQRDARQFDLIIRQSYQPRPSLLQNVSVIHQYLIQNYT